MSTKFGSREVNTEMTKEITDKRKLKYILAARVGPQGPSHFTNQAPKAQEFDAQNTSEAGVQGRTKHISVV